MVQQTNLWHTNAQHFLLLSALLWQLIFTPCVRQYYKLHLLLANVRSCLAFPLNFWPTHIFPVEIALCLVRTHHSRRWASRCVRCPGAACCLPGEFCRSVVAWRAGICWRCPPQRHPVTGSPAGKDSWTSLRKPALYPEWTWDCILFQWLGKSWKGSLGDLYFAQ